MRHVMRKQQNAEIDNLIMFNLEYYKSEGKEAIDQRIQELDREWDVERTLQMNAAAFALTGTLLAAVADKRWMLVSFFGGRVPGTACPSWVVPAGGDPQTDGSAHASGD